MHLLLGTTFIDKFIGGKLLKKRNIVPVHVTPATILGQGTEAHVSKILSHKAPMDKLDEHRMNLVAKLITIPAKAKSNAVFIH